jgi:UDP-2,3-diacylglucosamine hydrolase
MSKTHFVSDLHLFANRSLGERYLHAIAQKAAAADNFVLGGDIFDFRWSRRKTIRHSVGEAIQWLDDLAEECPNCHFYYLLGNHDCHEMFTGELARLEGAVDNLSHHHFFVRLGSSVFLHGDVADEHMDAEMLADSRRKWMHPKKRGYLLSGVYDVVVATRMHLPIPYVVYPRRVVAGRILTYLNAIDQGPASGARNVYFGHTHRAMADYEYGGLVFHNGGAPIKGMKFRILEAVG